MPQPKRSTPPSAVPFRASLIVWVLLLLTWAGAPATQQAWATTLWIWPQTGPLNHVFAAAIAAPPLWIGCSGQIGAALWGPACVQ